MPLDIGIPVVEQRKLMDVDPSGETWVRVRQARHREEIERLKVLFTPRQTPLDQQIARVKEMILAQSDPGEDLQEIFGLVLQIARDYKDSPGILLDELYALECFLTFEECNIEMGGDILFTSGMKSDKSAFDAAYAKLPYSVARNWQQEVWEVNPDWSPFRSAAVSAESASESQSEAT